MSKPSSPEKDFLADLGVPQDDLCPRGGVSKFQRFIAVTIPRKAINNAPFNPRRIDDYAKKKLRESLTNFGLAETLVWNRRSGNLVGGHQRLEQLDKLEGSRDYSLTVAVVDLDDVKERELNVVLNNANLSGEWDIDALAELLKFEGVNYEDVGFDRIDLEMLFDDAQLSTMFASENDAAAPVMQDLAQIKKDKKEHQEAARKAQDPEFYVCLVFRDREETEAFAALMDEPAGERYLNGSRIADKIRALRGESN